MCVFLGVAIIEGTVFRKFSLSVLKMNEDKTDFVLNFELSGERECEHSSIDRCTTVTIVDFFLLSRCRENTPST